MEPEVVREVLVATDSSETSKAAVRAAPPLRASIRGTRYARIHAIDLLVLGAHGRTGVSRVLLGSVAERVIRTASCPVLTVPHPVFGHGEEARVLPPSVHHCVVCNTLSRDLVCKTCRERLRGERDYASRPGATVERPEGVGLPGDD